MAERLVPTPAAVQAEGVPVTKMTGMMKMTGFNPKSITSDAELAELSGLLRDWEYPETNEEIKQVFRRLALSSRSQSGKQTGREIWDIGEAYKL